jgi:hypothetical protein
MIQGELYYYEKKLSDLNSGIETRDVSRIHILGVSPQFVTEHLNLSTQELKVSLRDEFSLAFLALLKDTPFSFALSFWERLISPKQSLQSSESVTPQTEFQVEVNNWIQRYDFEELVEILRNGSYTSNEEDFAIYYALSVIYELSTSKQNVSHAASPQPFSPFQTDDQLSLQPQILVVTDIAKSPLFKHISCEVLHVADEEPKKVLQHILDHLHHNPNVKLVLIDKEVITSFTFEYIQKRLPEGILVTELNLNNLKLTSSQTFFDHLAKQTLGIKL